MHTSHHLDSIHSDNIKLSIRISYSNFLKEKGIENDEMIAFCFCYSINFSLNCILIDTFSIYFPEIK